MLGKDGVVGRSAVQKRTVPFFFQARDGHPLADPKGVELPDDGARARPAKSLGSSQKPRGGPPEDFHAHGKAPDWPIRRGSQLRRLFFVRGLLSGF
jgi:hypothetical protein